MSTAGALVSVSTSQAVRRRLPLMQVRAVNGVPRVAGVSVASERVTNIVFSMYACIAGRTAKTNASANTTAAAAMPPTQARNRFVIFKFPSEPVERKKAKTLPPAMPYGRRPPPLKKSLMPPFPGDRANLISGRARPGRSGRFHNFVQMAPDYGFRISFIGL